MADKTHNGGDNPQTTTNPKPTPSHPPPSAPTESTHYESRTQTGASPTLSRPIRASPKLPFSPGSSRLSSAPGGPLLLFVPASPRLSSAPESPRLPHAFARASIAEDCEPNNIVISGESDMVVHPSVGTIWRPISVAPGDRPAPRCQRERLLIHNGRCLKKTAGFMVPYEVYKALLLGHWENKDKDEEKYPEIIPPESWSDP
ncbi:hypothetical protein BGX23_001865 [Mortierella sp. AD031]|nr:hypothetical protein BGX23_001865 [Mortierella sp. AD031]